jgi:hypothetical protein
MIWFISKAAVGATLRRFICAIAASFQLRVSPRVRPSAYIIMVSFELALLDWNAIHDHDKWLRPPQFSFALNYTFVPFLLLTRCCCCLSGERQHRTNNKWRWWWEIASEWCMAFSSGCVSKRS